MVAITPTMGPYTTFNPVVGRSCSLEDCVQLFSAFQMASRPNAGLGFYEYRAFGLDENLAATPPNYPFNS